MEDSRIEDMIEALTAFSAVLKAQRGQPSLHLDVLMDAHLHTRKKLARVVSLIAQSDLTRALDSVDSAIENIAQFLRNSLSGQVDPKHIKIRGYRGVHGMLLEYLLRHEGRNVSGEALRALVGDQIHTERRIRELRDLGFELATIKENGVDFYRLAHKRQDLGYASKFILRKTLKSHRTDFSDREIAHVEAYLAS